jgi:DNA-binding response OmpR family regulator
LTVRRGAFDAAVTADGYGAPPEDQEVRMAHILVIDEDRVLRGTVESILIAEGHAVVSERSGYEALKRLRSSSFDLVACDAAMAHGEGLETIREMRHLRADLPIIAFTEGTAAAEAELPRVGGRPGGTETLAKPFRRQELLALVRRYFPLADGS